MRFVHRAALTAVAAMAAIAVAAPAAPAFDGIQVVNEDTGTQCSAVETLFVLENLPFDFHDVPYGIGGCTVHAVGTATLRIDLVFFETNEATCNLEVEMRVGGNGTMAIDAVEHSTGPDANCATVMTECTSPWGGSGEEDSPVGVVQSSVLVCLNPSESDTDCFGNLALSLVEHTGEHYEAQFNNATVGICELDVDLEFEHFFSGNVDVHINHP